MKFRTKKAEHLFSLWKNKEKEFQKAEEKNQKIFFDYCQMEGKYGKKVFSDCDIEQGFRGYHYEYPSAEIQQKESAERKNFLIENGFQSKEELNEIFIPILLNLENQFYLEQYNMTVQEFRFTKALKKTEKEIKEQQKLAQYYLSKIKEEQEKRLKKNAATEV